VRPRYALFALLLSCRSAPPADVAAPRPPAVLARPYAMHEPLHHDPRAPLLIFLHGFGGNHAEAAGRFGIDALADAHGERGCVGGSAPA
jgi:poly(3-hydroxybutyrate) depolymerase